jgi:protein-tyrosine phosphatase
MVIFRNSDEIFDMLLGAGIIPIITHPERNYLLQQRMKELEAWVGKGILVQVTGQSFLGRFGGQAQKFAETLMRRRLVHFIASDAHDLNDRSPDLSGAYQAVANRYGEDIAEELFVLNPGCALKGEIIDLSGRARPVLTKKWYKFWK